MSCVRMPASLGTSDVTDDAALGGRLHLLQPRKGHRFGHDAVLLAAAVEAAPGDLVVELGAGVGLVGLAVAHRVPGAQVTLIERDPDLAALAKANAERNGLADRVRVVTLDVTSTPKAFAQAGLSAGCARHVMMNPPFNRVDAQVSPDRNRAAAHTGTPSLLADWVGSAARLLPEKGILTLIWRADGLGDVLSSLTPGFGGIAVVPVYPRAAAPAIRILATAVKGSRAPLHLLPGLALQDALGPTAAAERVLRDGEPLQPSAADRSTEGAA